ncbi:MAG: MFS transporter [Clostridia bacterium]|nr:MFS transporter [Clostridia bacterium]
MKNEKTKKSIFESPLFRTKIKSANVKFPEVVLGYLIGPLGGLLAGGIFGAVLNNYWTDILFAGVKTQEITTFLTILPLLSAILIVAGNLIAGQIIERTRTKAGKARPWILLSSILLTVACILMFIMPAGADPAVTMVVTGISYNLYYAVAYPLYNAANSTLIPVSTRNSSQRGLLASVSNVATLGVMGAGTMIFPALAGLIIYPNGQPAMLIAFIAVGVVTFLATVLQYFFTRERVTEETFAMPVEKNKVSMGQQLKAVVKDKFWWVVIITYLIFQFAGGLKNASMIFYCKQVIDNSFWGAGEGGWGLTQTLLGVLGAIPMAIAMAFIWPLSNKVTKRWVVLVGLAVAIGGGIIAAVTTNVVVVSIGIALRCFGEAPICYMILAMFADVLDHVEAKNGFRPDGFTMSIYSAIMVAAPPVMTGLFNLMTNTGDNTEMVAFSFTWFQVIAYGVCVALLFLFGVEKGLSKDRETIKLNQKAAVEAAGGVWEDPEEKLKREEAEAAASAEEARKEELKALCEKKGLSYEEEEAKYQAMLAEKEAKKKAKQEAKEAKKK